MEFQLDVIGPDGTPQGTVYSDVTLELDIMTRGRSTGTVTVEAAAVDHTYLTDKRNTVAVKRWNGTGWVEPDNAHFACTRLGTDSLELEGGGSLTRRYTLTSIAAALKGASPCFPDYNGRTLGEGTGPTEWTFEAHTPGQILTALFTRVDYIAGSTGGFGGWARALVRKTFTATHDSLGRPWAHKLTYSFDGSGTLLDALNGLAERGVIDWYLRGRDLMIINAVAVTTAPAATTLRELALELMDEATEEESRGDVVNHVIVQGEPAPGTNQNRYWAIKHATAADGVMTRTVKAAGVTTAAAAQLVADHVFAQFATPQLQISRRWTHSDPTTLQPFHDFNLGDWLSVERVVRRGVEDITLHEAYKVVKIHLGAAGTCQATLGSLLEYAQDRLARAVAALAGGGISAATGSTQRPAPPPSTAPRAPQALLTQAMTAIAEDGTAMGQVLAQWQAVTLGAGGEELKIYTYELESSHGRDGVPVTWASAGLVHAGVTQWVSGWIPPGTRYGLRVRAVTDAGVKGPWSSEAWTVIERDTIAPPTPSALTAVSTWGTVSLTWDGRDATGDLMPNDFLRLDVQGRVVGTGAWSTVPAITSASGTSIHVDLTPGDTWEYQARAVDRSGNTSDWSTVTTVKIISIQDDPDYIKARDAVLAAAEATARTASTQIATNLDQAVKATIIDQWGPLTTAPTTSRAGGPIVVGSTYQDATRGNLTRIWNGTAWSDVRWESASVGKMLAVNLGDGAVKTAALAPAAVDISKLNVTSVTGSIGFISKFFANTATIGHVRAQAIYSEMFKGKSFEGGTFSGQIMNAVTINGATINLTATGWDTGKLVVRGAGVLQAAQVDANGFHILADYRRGEKWVSLGMDRVLRFSGAGQGAIEIEGKQADILMTTDLLHDNSNISAIMFMTKHLPGDVRLRAPGIAVMPGGVKFRIDGVALQGAVAHGTIIELGFQGDQDAIALGHCSEQAMAAKTGGYLKVDPLAFQYINNGGNEKFPNFYIGASGIRLGGRMGQQSPHAFVHGEVNKMSIGANAQDLSISRIDMNVLSMSFYAKVESVFRSNVRITGSVSAANKLFEIVHPTPAKAQLGAVLRHGVIEGPSTSVQYRSHEPVTIGATGTTYVALPDYVADLCHPEVNIQTTAISESGEQVSPYGISTAGFTVHGTPGVQFHWVAHAERKDVPKLTPEIIDAERAVTIGERTPASDEAMDALLNGAGEGIIPGDAPSPPIDPEIPIDDLGFIFV